MGILVVKVIGLFYKIPLVNIIGSEGSADFNNAYNIYSVLLTISTAGLPVAVSKMVSEANALGAAEPGAQGVPPVPGSLPDPGCGILPDHVFWLRAAGRHDARLPLRRRASARWRRR